MHTNSRLTVELPAPQPSRGMSITSACSRVLGKRGQQGVALPAATESRSIAVMVGLEGAFLGDVDVGGLFWRQFG